MLRSVLILTFVILSSNLFSQVNEGGLPLTFQNDRKSQNLLKSIKHVQEIILDSIDNQRETKITDSLNYYSDIKLKYYGKILSVDIDVIKDTEPVYTEEGILYLINLKSATAFGLQFFFDDFHIPDGGKLYIYNGVKDMVLGAFTSKNNEAQRNFGTQYIKGNSIYLEYYQPYKTTEKAAIHINRLVHVFTPLLTNRDEWGESSYCEIDVACEMDEKWKENARSVALILAINPSLRYAHWCTGALLNNSQNDGKPLFLSAAHCADGMRVFLEDSTTHPADFKNWIFLFNYQRLDCDTNARDPGYNNSVYGAQLLSIDTSLALPDNPDRYYTDHLLLRLNASPEDLKKYNVVYAGWDANEDSALQSFYTKSIHHPSGDVKKISSGGIPYSFNRIPLYPEETHWRVSWYEGIVEKGSSGGPLFNMNYKIIGQLTSGGSSCFGIGFDNFGKLSLSYEYGNLQQWLDPENTNAKSLNSYNPGTRTLGKNNIFRYFYDRNSNILHIIFLESSRPSFADVLISDITGHTIFQKTYYNEYRNQFSVFLPDLSTGVYILRMKYLYETESRKMVIAK